VISEWLIENKFTKVYFYLDEVGGLANYALYFVLYIALVELGIYWVHRTLHTNKFLYKYVHGLHHKYNKALTLTPVVIAVCPNSLFFFTKYIVIIFLNI